MSKWVFSIVQSKRTPKDLLALFLLAILLLWQPFYQHQELNLFEWGLYLPGIDAVSQGQVPFRDFFHLRGPFELYVPDLFMKIFGFRADVLATYFYVGTVVTIIVSILIAYELIEQRFLLYPLLLILVTKTFPRVVFTFWGGMRYAWGLLALWCLIRFLKSCKPGWLLAGGMLAAIGLGTSIEIGVIATMAFFVVALFSQKDRRSIGVFAAGFLIILLPYIAYLVSQHALGEYLHSQLVVVTQMGKTFLQTDPVPDTVPKFLRAVFFPLDKSFYKTTPIYTYIFFFPWYAWRLSHKKCQVLDHAALALAVYGLVLFITGFRNFYAAEYEMSMQPQKVLMFYLLSQLIVASQQKLKDYPWVSLVLILGVILSSAIFGINHYKERFYKSSWVYPMDPRKPEKINGSLVKAIDLPRIQGMTIPVWQATDLEQLKQFVDQHVPVHEAIWMYPELGTLNFILNRPWVGRFPMATLSWMSDAWFEEYFSTLERNPPRYAIVNKVMPFYFDSQYFQVRANRIKHERVMQFLSQHYVVDRQTPTYFIYKRT